MDKRLSPATAVVPADDAERIVRAFVDARLGGRALDRFPGSVPSTLESAYAVQDLAIAHWPTAVLGWKVGYIAAARRDVSGDDRLLGPMFAGQVHTVAGDDDGDGDDTIEVFANGFGAVEAEYVLQLDADAPADKLDWTPDEAAALPSRLFVGLEVASSPLATINALGPLVVVSDFGNNNGLLIGPRIDGWPRIDDAALRCETFIDGVSVGSGGAASLPGGLRAAFAFALSRSARRGRPLRLGDLVATGNATGIHDIRPGQRARIVFDGYGAIAVAAVAAPDRSGMAAAG